MIWKVTYICFLQKTDASVRMYLSVNKFASSTGGALAPLQILLRQHKIVIRTSIVLYWDAPADMMLLRQYN